MAKKSAASVQEAQASFAEQFSELHPDDAVDALLTSGIDIGQVPVDTSDELGETEQSEDVETLDESDDSTDESPDVTDEIEGDDLADEPDVADEVDEDEEEPDEEITADSDATYVVTDAEGNDVEVTVDDLINGYQFAASNTRTAQANAQEAREIQERAEAIEAERTQYAQGLQVLEQALKATIPPEPDWNTLTSEQRTELLYRQRQLEQVQAEQQAVFARQQEEAEAARAERVGREQGQLLEKTPEWEDDAVRAAEVSRMLEIATGHYGFTPEEVSDTDDHRSLLMLRDATRYRDLKEKGKTVTRKAKPKSPTMKAGRASPPGARKKKDDVVLAAARKRFAQSGKEKDALPLVERLLANEG